MATPMASNLAESQTMRMTQGQSSRGPEWMRSYMESLINPFSMSMKSTKLLDGEVKHTAGVKLRATGEIICNPNGNTNIVIFPGLTNTICYDLNPAWNGDEEHFDPEHPFHETLLDGRSNIEQTIFRQHLSTTIDRKSVRLARVVGAGARFFLTNSAEEDDGYWEAARYTATGINDVFTQEDSRGEIAMFTPKVKLIDYELANNVTYQYGQLRDLHKFIFKLNSTDNDHKMSPVVGWTNTNSSMTSLDQKALHDVEQWDMIFIKIRGRRSVGSPSVLRFDSVSNQEIVYNEHSPLARMMDETPRDANMDGYLEHSRVDTPAFQATP